MGSDYDGAMRAWLIPAVMVSACGGGGGGDPVLPDAGIPGDVTVTAYRVAPPFDVASNLDITAIDPDGTSRSTVTDATGTATIDVAPGGSVAAVYLEDHAVHMVVGAEPGDTLTFGYPLLPLDRGTEVGTLTVTMPTIPSVTSYSVHSSCGGASAIQPPVTLTIYSTCPATDDLVVLADNGNAFDGILGYAVLSSVSLDAGGSASVGAWETPTSLTLSVDDFSPEVLNYFLLAAGTVEGEGYGSILAGTGDVTSTGPSATATLHWAPVGDSARALLSTNSYEGQHRVSDPIAPDATSHTFVMNGLPWITDVSVDLAQATANITIDGDYPFDRADVAFSGRTSDSVAVSWTVTAPAPTTEGATAIPFVMLPDPFDQLNPVTDIPDVWPSVSLQDAVADDGYDDARQHQPTEDASTGGTRTVTR